MSTLVAGVRSAAGQPSGPQIAADTGIAIDTSLATSAGHQPSGGRSFRKQRTVNPPMAPARYNFVYLSKAGPAGGRLQGPSSAGRPAMDGYSRYSRSVTVLGMESPLRRALRWLGFTQPNSSVGAGTPFFGTPFRASYVCPTCGALVATSAQERHVDWHVKIGG